MASINAFISIPIGMPKGSCILQGITTALHEGHKIKLSNADLWLSLPNKSILFEIVVDNY